METKHVLDISLYVSLIASGLLLIVLLLIYCFQPSKFPHYIFSLQHIFLCRYVYTGKKIWKQHKSTSLSFCPRLNFFLVPDRLIVYWATFGFQYGLDAPGHGVNEFHYNFWLNTRPRVFSGLDELGTSFDGSFGTNTLFHHVPKIFNWAQVCAVRWPHHNRDFVPFKPLGTPPRFMTGGIILLKDDCSPVTISINKWQNIFT